ncbi:MAG: hypothetical protein AB4290_20615 [Spirulina sp.]
MSKRIAITLPDSINDALEQWAKDEGRPLAGLCSYLLEQNVRASAYDPTKQKEKSNQAKDN